MRVTYTRGEVKTVDLYNLYEGQIGVVEGVEVDAEVEGDEPSKGSVYLRTARSAVCLDGDGHSFEPCKTLTGVHVRILEPKSVVTLTVEESEPC